jgi:predicted small secreted protein
MMNRSAAVSMLLLASSTNIAGNPSVESAPEN